MQKLVFVCNEDALDVTKASGTPHYMASALIERFPDLVIEREPWPRWARALRDAVLKVTRGYWTPIYWPWLNRVLSDRIHRRHPQAAFIVPVASNLAAELGRRSAVLNITDAVRADLAGPFYVPFRRMNVSHQKMADDAERNSLVLSKHTTFSSPWAASGAVKHYGARLETLSVVPWGCNLDWIPERQNGQQEEMCRLIFIGMDWLRKGGDIVLEVACELQKRQMEFTIDLIGAPPPDLAVLSENINVIGPLRKNNVDENSRLNGLLDRASFLLLPTRADCTPMVFAEANAYGVPAVTCDVGGVAGVVKNGVNGLLLSADASAKMIADEIERCWRNKVEYNLLRETSRKYYEDHLNWSAWAEAIAPTIRKLLMVKQ